MARADRPSSPTDDLAAIRAWSGPLAGGILTPELMDFCQSGISVIVAAGDGEGAPIAGMALGCTIEPDGLVRIILRRSVSESILRNLGPEARIAATFSQPTTHRSIQIKGVAPRVEDLSPTDDARLDEQVRSFRAELVAVGYDETFAAFYCAYEPQDMLIVAFTPVQCFVQTPGPSAGSALRP